MSGHSIEMLRFSTAGSVDDGKSTLIGRLLYDSKTVFEDQLEAIARTSAKTGTTGIDLSLLTDGLAAEREQKITIDVAYRYFSTPKRKFIIADTPGHEQYTRNMVTGASTCDLAIILVDARKGVLPQSRRHAYISALLGIPHLVVAINKMDLVEFSQTVYDQIVSEMTTLMAGFTLKDITFIPVSALLGDNIVKRSEQMPWYKGPALLEHLEQVSVHEPNRSVSFRFPVQMVIRPNLDFRGYAGQVLEGGIKVGDTVTVLPSQKSSKVKMISTYDGERSGAQAGDAVTILLEDEIDISRGDILVDADHLPQSSAQITATLCWMHEQPLKLNKKYFIKHGCQWVQGMITAVDHVIDIQNLKNIPATDDLGLNTIAQVQIRLKRPIYFDPYTISRSMGAFIVSDELSNATVAAGMIV